MGYIGPESCFSFNLSFPYTGQHVRMKMQLHAAGYALFYVPRSSSVLVMNFASFNHIYYPTLQPSTTTALLCVKFSVSLSFPTLNISETKTKEWGRNICTFYK